MKDESSSNWNTSLSLVSELDKAQPVVEPVLYKSAEISGGAGQGFVLADRPAERGQADRAGVPAEAAARRALLPRALRSLVQVSS